MRWRAPLLLLLIGCNPGYASWFGDTGARKQIAEQQVLLGDLFNQGRTLEERLAKLEERGLLELHNQIETLRLDLNKLYGQIEVLVNENELAQKRQRDFYIDLDSRLRRLERPDESVAPTSAAAEPEAEAIVQPPAAAVTPPATSVAPSTTPSVENRAYEAAYSLFKSGNYQGAISRFRSFLERYPKSGLAPSAHYWIGNSYYALHDFDNAIDTQQKLIKAFPDSAKSPDALLNIASSQKEMKKNTASRKTLEDLIARYPGSEAAEKAKQRLTIRQ